MAKVLLKNKAGEPFVTKKGKSYYINGFKFIGDESLILDAVANVKETTYSELTAAHNNKTITDKETFWKVAFNYMWSGGGLICWYNVQEYWDHELARRGELLCECGHKKIMYYTPYCPNCEQIGKVHGHYNFFQMRYKIEAKNNIKEKHEFWTRVLLPYFESKGWRGNDSNTEVNFQEIYDKWCPNEYQKDHCQLYINEFGTKTYPVLISW